MSLNLSATIEKQWDKELSAVIVRSTIDGKKSNHKKLNIPDFFSDRVLIIKVIQAGLPYSFFNLILNFAPFTEKDWSEFLDLSGKSLQRYKQSEKDFRPIHSEKIIEMAEVTITGLDVFGDMEKFRMWLHTPSFALGSVCPVELLKDSYGKELVMSELIKIEHGILA
ncbi:MAG: DUF2384 domain-containing protein [Bacteroidia bacterium]|nr:DUF2384 domain-containing protein [Bacteroidia bacterium]